MGSINIIKQSIDNKIWMFKWMHWSRHNSLQISFKKSAISNYTEENEDIDYSIIQTLSAGQSYFMKLKSNELVILYTTLLTFKEFFTCIILWNTCLWIIFRFQCPSVILSAHTNKPHLLQINIFSEKVELFGVKMFYNTRKITALALLIVSVFIQMLKLIPILYSCSSAQLRGQHGIFGLK